MDKWQKMTDMEVNKGNTMRKYRELQKSTEVSNDRYP
jgi:hypothetical protein